MPGPGTEAEVKRAYAARLKAIDRSDVGSFAALRAAYDAARRRASDGAPAGRVRPSMAELGAKAPRAPVAGPDPAQDAGPTPRKASDPPPSNPGDSSPPPALPPSPPKARLEPPPDPAPIARPAAEHLPVRPPSESATGPAMVEIIAEWVRAALEGGDVNGLGAALNRADRLDRDGRIEIERTVIRLLHADRSRITPEIAAPIDATFGWAEDALGTQKRIGDTVGHGPLYALFVSALRRAAPRPPEPAAPPADPVALPVDPVAPPVDPVEAEPPEPLRPLDLVCAIAVLIALVQAVMEASNSTGDEAGLLVGIVTFFATGFLVAGAFMANWVVLWIATWLLGVLARLFPASLGIGGAYGEAAHRCRSRGFTVSFFAAALACLTVLPFVVFSPEMPAIERSGATTGGSVETGS